MILKVTMSIAIMAIVRNNFIIKILFFPKEKIREKFGMGLGTKKINGKSSRVFMRPGDTDQELRY